MLPICHGQCVHNDPAEDKQQSRVRFQLRDPRAMLGDEMGPVPKLNACRNGARDQLLLVPLSRHVVQPSTMRTQPVHSSSLLQRLPPQL